MRKFITLIMIAFTVAVSAQIHNPVKWTTQAQKINDNEYNLVAFATIENGWKLYGQHLPANGPVPTTFTFEKQEGYELVGTPNLALPSPPMTIQQLPLPAIQKQ